MCVQIPSLALMASDPQKESPENYRSKNKFILIFTLQKDPRSTLESLIF